MKKGIEAMLPQLHTTVAVAGWLRENDAADFQLAWGELFVPTKIRVSDATVQLSHVLLCPGIQNTNTPDKKDDHKLRIRQMKRFYSIYNPPLVHLCEHFMETLQRKLKKDFSWDR